MNNVPTPEQMVGVKRRASVSDRLNEASVKYAESKANAMAAVSWVLIWFALCVLVPMALAAVKAIEFIRAFSP